MKKAILFLFLILLVVFVGMQVTQSAKVRNQADAAPSANKVGPINFALMENHAVDNSNADRYSVGLSVPTPAPTPPPIPTPTPKPNYSQETVAEDNPYKIIVDISDQLVSIMTKDEDGAYTNVYRQFYCSTGLGGTPTVIGNFKVREKKPWLESYPSLRNGVEYQVYAHYRTTIYNDYHFHSILYEGRRDFDSLLRSSFYNLGRKASHGCIRLLTRDAKWIYMNCDIGTPISIVTSGGPDKDKSVLFSIPYYKDLPRGVYFDPTDLAVVEDLLELKEK